MPYPKSFYYKEQGEEPEFSIIPQGQPDINKLLKSQPAWIKSNSTEEKKKKLILADWTALNWGDEKTQQIKKALTKLMNDGFEIYQWQHGKVVTLNKNQLSALDDEERNKSMTLVHMDIILNAAMEQHPNLVKNEIHVLNDYWLQMLIENSDVLTPRKIRTHHIPRYNNSHNYSHFLTILDSYQPKLEEFTHNYYSKKMNAWIKEIRSNFPHLHIEPNYKVLDFAFSDSNESNEIKNKLAGLADNNNDIVIEGETLSASQLDKIEHIIINYSGTKTTQNFLLNLLLKTNELKSLKLFGLPDMGDISSEIELPNLETLVLTFARGSNKFLYLIAKSKNLKTLRLNSLDFKEELTENFDFPLLKSVCVEYSILSLKNLGHFLAKSNQLKKLDLNHCQLDGEFPNIDLLSLEEIDLTEATILTRSLENLLVNSRNLKIIKLKRCKLDSDFISTLDLRFLEQIDLSNSVISAKNLENLLINARNLKHIDLSSCRIEGDITKILNLSSVENMDLGHAKLSAKSLESLLVNGCNIKDIQLSHCELQGEITKIPNLSSLEKINLLSTTISAKSIESLLVTAKNIKYINLESHKEFGNHSFINWHDVRGDFTKSLDLPFLERIDIKSVSISASNLDYLLANAKNLKHFNLVVSNLENDFTQDLALYSLEILNLSGTSLSAKNLESIVENAKNIKNIDLVGCEIKGVFTKDLNLSSLEILKLSSDDFSLKNLEALLVNAKNIKEIHLSSCKLKGNFSKTIALISVKMINMNYMVISAKNLETLLAESRNLEDLNLGYCKIDGSLTGNINLSSLKSLNLANATITAESLEHILTHATNLKSLDLYECKIIGTLKTSFNFSLLESLDLREAILNVHNNESFIADAPNLKELNLTGYEQADTILKMSTLPELKSLSLGEGTFSARQIDQYLLQSMKLETLNITSSKIEGNLSGDFVLSKLTHLDLSGTTFSQRNLEYLAARAKNLDLSNPYQVRGIKRRSETSSPGSREVQQPYNSASHLTRTPTAHDFTFIYKGKNKTLNQTMVVEQLSQYLTITNSPDCKYLYKMKDGICESLCNLYESKSTKEMNDLLKTLSAWDGGKIPDKKTIGYLNEVLDCYKSTYHKGMLDELTAMFDNTTFIGDSFSQLPTPNSDESYTLNNPWHAIHIKYVQLENKYHIYDPNFPEGVKVVAANELHNIVEASLGNLIFIKNYNSIRPHIEDKPLFIRNGGLLVLCRSPDILDIIATDFKNYEEKDLEGLLIRDTNGMPAWIRGIQSDDQRLQIYTEKLLEQFIQKNPTKHRYLLAKSISGIYGFEYLALAETLIRPSIEFPDRDVGKKIIPILENKKRPDLTTIFEKQLETWNKNKPHFQPIEVYFQSVVSGEKKKRLIELNSTESVEAMSLRLQQHCLSIGRPFFCVESPDDLICSAPYVKRVGDIGELHKRPGGPLHEFLMKNHDKSNPPVIIVRYDKFDAADMVRFNSLLDDIRKADGIELPECASVVGLINPNDPNSYKGNDFSSRMGVNNVDACDLSAQQIRPVNTISQINEKPNDYSAKTFPINLCHAQDWKERLLGHWILKEDKLYFKEGILKTALDSGLPIEIQNGLWENASFRYFWDRALTLGYVTAYDEKIHFNPKTEIISYEGYDWEKLRQYGRWTVGLQTETQILNPNLCSDYFNIYECNNHTHQINLVNGWIKANQGKTLSVNVTRSLNEDEWAMLLIECEKYEVRLDCHCSPSITLPSILDIYSPNKSVPIYSSFDAKLIESSVIHSTDIDVTVALLTKSKENWKVIDISECTSSDLLTYLNVEFNEKELQFKFTESSRFLKKALANNENIILTGKFSPELADKLASILLDKFNKKDSPGKLILVSNDTELFNYLPLKKHEVILDEKIELLNGKFDESKINTLTSLETESLSQSIARLSYPAIPNNNLDPWQGLRGLSGGIQLKPFDPIQSKAISEAFIQHRLDCVHAILRNAPYVYLTGLTGVGKSTFVDKYMSSGNSTLYQGETSLHAWANDTSDQLKILFLDEANITSKQWSELKGLFNNPPGILIDGKYSPLTDKHKVIFAGNPLNYGGERKFASFFEQHGNALVFDPMPSEFIYEQILRPVFYGTDLEKHALDISIEILNMYQFLCECSQDTILISPRELQQMALFVLAHVNNRINNPTIDPVKLARYYSFQIGESLTPEIHKVKLHQKFPVEPLPKIIDVQPDKFLVTPSREPLYQQLTDLVSLREFRRNLAKNDAQRYGGLGGIIIEGEPGIGKSDVVIACLIAHGYQEAGKANQTDKIFYKIPVSMPLSEKKKLLLEAFHRGAVVVIDEINSSPMMERFMNDLLMGKNPEKGRCRVLMREQEPKIEDMTRDDIVALHKDGQLTIYWLENGKLVNHSFGETIVESIAERLPKIGEESRDLTLIQDIISKYGCSVRLDDRPDNPGCVFIGTQNPATMAGRRKLSAAVASRLISTYLPPYSEQEMKAILTHRGVDEFAADSMVNTYITKLNQAKHEHLTPAPTFRDLMNTATIYLEAHKIVHASELMAKTTPIEKEVEKKVPRKSIPAPDKLTGGISQQGFFSHEIPLENLKIIAQISSQIQTLREKISDDKNNKDKIESWQQKINVLEAARSVLFDSNKSPDLSEAIKQNTRYNEGYLSQTTSQLIESTMKVIARPNPKKTRPPQPPPRKVRG